jgi:hypothetical protein
MIPWSINPAWFALLAFAVPALTWLGFAWRQALAEDPHRARRAGIRELRRLLARVRRLRSAPRPQDLHGWCRATARAWGVRVSAPCAREISVALQTHTGNVAVTSTWHELWCATERGLYAPDGTTPPDWLDRAASAAASMEVPRRERWFPNRLAHWLPGLVIGMLTAVASPSPAFAEGTVEAHLTVATSEMQAGHWNAAVAHATAAFVRSPSSTATQETLRAALQQAGSADPVLRRLLFGATYQRMPALFSPGAWQRVALVASVIIAAAFAALVTALYARNRRRQLSLIGSSTAVVGVALFLTAISGWNAYGALNDPTAAILLRTVNVSPVPTDLVPEQETSPVPAGSVVVTSRSFLGWLQIRSGSSPTSGWVRANAVLPCY